MEEDFKKEVLRKDLQETCVNSRKIIKEKMKLKELNRVKDLDFKSYCQFSILCCGLIYKRCVNQGLEPKVLKLNYQDNRSSYAIMCRGIIVDPAIDYFVASNKFSYVINDYPLKLENYEFLSEDFLFSGD